MILWSLTGGAVSVMVVILLVFPALFVLWKLPSINVFNAVDQQRIEK